MQHPIIGYMVQYAQPNEEYYPHWNSQTHVHEFIGETTITEAHKHNYVGTTDPAPNGIQHTHDYYTWTLYVDGHRHQISGRTGPAIPVQGGGHVHYYEGYTTGFTEHQHWYSGYTNRVIEKA